MKQFQLLMLAMLISTLVFAGKNETLTINKTKTEKTSAPSCTVTTSVAQTGTYVCNKVSISVTATATATATANNCEAAMAAAVKQAGIEAHAALMQAINAAAAACNAPNPNVPA